MTDIPNIVQGKVVPSSIQFHGETFHREKNVDEWFCELYRLLTTAIEWDKNPNEQTTEALKAAISHADRVNNVQK